MRSGETSDIPFLGDSATFEKRQYRISTTSPLALTLAITTAQRRIQLTSAMSLLLARAMGKWEYGLQLCGHGFSEKGVMLGVC